MLFRRLNVKIQYHKLHCSEAWRTNMETLKHRTFHLPLACAGRTPPINSSSNTPFTRYKRLSNWLNNRLNVCLHDWLWQSGGVNSSAARRDTDSTVGWPKRYALIHNLLLLGSGLVYRERCRVNNISRISHIPRQSTGHWVTYSRPMYNYASDAQYYRLLECGHESCHWNARHAVTVHWAIGAESTTFHG